MPLQHENSSSSSDGWAFAHRRRPPPDVPPASQDSWPSATQESLLPPTQNSGTAYPDEPRSSPPHLLDPPPQPLSEEDIPPASQRQLQTAPESLPSLLDLDDATPSQRLRKITLFEYYETFHQVRMRRREQGRPSGREEGDAVWELLQVTLGRTGELDEIVDLGDAELKGMGFPDDWLDDLRDSIKTFLLERGPTRPRSPGEENGVVKQYRFRVNDETWGH